MKNAWLCAALVVSLAGGCADTPDPQDRRSSTETCYRHGDIRTCGANFSPSRDQVAQVHRLRPPEKGVGRLIVVRNAMLDAHGQAALSLDGTALASLIPCSVLGVDVAPGLHRLQVGNQANAGAQLELTLKPEAVAVVQVRRTPGGAGPRGFSLARLERAEALGLIQECPVLGMLDRTSKPDAP